MSRADRAEATTMLSRLLEKRLESRKRFRPDSNYVKTITRRLLSDGVSDTDPSPSADKPGNPADGAKEEQTTANEEEA